jgi:YidC/Oxa1 family membrane protein insertase
MQSKQPDDQNNVMLAVILSMMVLLGWNYFFAQPKLQQQQEQAERAKGTTIEQKAAESSSAPASSGGQTAPVASATAPSAPAKQLAATREEALGRSPRLAIDTPSLKGSIALKGGLIDDVVLANYHETVDPKSANVILLSPSEGPHAYFARYGWSSANPGQKTPDGETVWTQVSEGALTPANPARLTWDNDLHRRQVHVHGCRFGREQVGQ